MKEGIEILLKKISRNGMSKKCQKFLPKIAENYFEGIPLDLLKERLGKKNRGFADIIYGRLEQIKINGLKKASGYVGKHYRDLKIDAVFADSIIQFCRSNKLEKKTS